MGVSVHEADHAALGRIAIRMQYQRSCVLEQAAYLTLAEKESPSNLPGKGTSLVIVPPRPHLSKVSSSPSSTEH